ncbi:MAG: hypothetical protein ACTHMZ_05865 [Actinomycetes bacterium]
MASLPLSPASLAAATGLLGGFALAQSTGRRELGGAAFAAGGALAERQWLRTTGRVPAVGLGLGYAGAMGVSHPLAKKLGAWRSVLTVTAAVVLASEVLTRRS